MKREELIDMIMDHSAGATDNVADGVCYKMLADSILKRLSLPPAEGATDKFRDVLYEVQRFIETEGGATESEMKAIWNSLSCAITESERRSQPTAEGAEEILRKPKYNSLKNLTLICEAMEEFAALHAQRLAEKMVEEMCKKCKYRGLPDSIQEALNSGDGVYRP